MSKLLAQYIRHAVMEAHLARVPNQLISTDGHDGEEDAEEGLEEFCGVGGIMGYSAPLGMDPDLLGRQKNAPKRKRTKKTHG